MYEDPAITGGNETWSYWDTDMGVNESPIYRQVAPSQPTVDSILGGRFNTSWF